MSASPTPKPLHVHIHHHHHVGVGTLLAALGGIFVVQYSIVAWVLITNPASLRIFLETFVRPTTSSHLQPAGPRPSGDFEDFGVPKALKP
jgi:hypothetical protein